MEHFKEPADEKNPSAKSLNELMNLLMKLNAKLREKISPQQRKKDIGPENMEVVIIILSSQEGKTRPVRKTRSSKAESAEDDWIQDLCQQIERGSSPRKKS